MTNVEMIMKKLEELGLDKNTSVNTYAGWQREGRQVRKGEKALFSCKIWVKAGASEPAAGNAKSGDVVEYSTVSDEDMKASGFFLKNAFFFGMDQTEEMTAEEKEKYEKKKAGANRSKARTSKNYRNRELKHFKGCETMKDLSTQYRKLVKIYHPDNLETGDENIIKEIYREYGIVKKMILSGQTATQNKKAS